MRWGIFYALASAALFGVSTPLAKMLLGAVSPLALAGLLYAGSGLGLLLLRLGQALFAPATIPTGAPRGREWLSLAGAIFFGGVVGPVALMVGLTQSTASTASLLLNLETVFTALIAWIVFRENYGRRVLLGMLAIVSGGLVLAWVPGGSAAGPTGSLLIAAACLCWALDNNLTRRVSTADAVTIACLKGLIAGAVNLGLALALDRRLPSGNLVAGAAVIGFLGYGVSLVLFVHALRHLGSARTGAYFAVAPYFGAAVAVALQGDPLDWQLIVAGLLMALGIWLHVSERHQHRHAHERLEHTHRHFHDEHHRHAHEFEWDGREPHLHAHVHEPLVHTHAHYPDVHHRHPH